MFCTRLAIWFETCSISSSAAPAFSASSAPPTTSVVVRSIETTASFVSAWIVRTSTSICLRRVRGALREALHLVGDHREAAARLAGHRRLDRGVQRQDVGLLGDVVDELDDVADLLRALAEALDALESPGWSRGWRSCRRSCGARRRRPCARCRPSDARRPTSAPRCRRLPRSNRPCADDSEARGDLLRLRARRLRQVGGQRLRLPGGAVELDRRLVDRAHQVAQHARWRS